MDVDDSTGILVRFSGELATKSRRTRRRFRQRLVGTIEDALASAGVDFEVRAEWGRIFVSASGRAALDVLPRVFGIVSISEIEATTEAVLDRIVEVGERLWADRVAGRTFAVRTRRAGEHDFSSRDVNYRLGAALDRNGTVDLDDPEVSVQVEVRDDRAYLFSDRIPGPGGLPLGVEGRAAALLSGGYDSAVAAWMMLKRGVALDYIFCNLAGEAYERAVLGVAKSLADEWSYGTSPRIHVIDFEEVIDGLKASVRPNYWQVVLKRLMYRAGERVSAEIGAGAMVTGESVGQVSSQTLANLVAIEDSVSTPVLRPLIGFDKGDIIDRSRRIGTYALSEKVREYCALVEDRPVTETSPEEAARAEAGLDLEPLDRAIAGRRVLDLRSLSTSDLVMPYLYVEEVPADAVVIDVRTPGERSGWGYPGAVERDFWTLFRDVRELDNDRVYVLYCRLGLKSAQLAEKMQRAGYEAYSFRGGAPGLRRWAESAGRSGATVRTP